jgi:GTPase SAR1 family protein
MSFDIVFVGETNDGKTTIVSSLVEDENAVISMKPGTTKGAHQHTLTNLNNEPIISVWDTPGFEETDYMHDWFTRNASLRGNLAQEFIRNHRSDERFQRDVELLKPIAAGAIAVYVVASNRKPQADDQKQLELVRIAGANRIALINDKPGKDYTKEWKEVLKREIGIILEYSPLRAGIKQRLELLDKLANCSSEHQGIMLKAREALKKDWDDRLESLARSLIVAVYDSAKLTVNSEKSDADARNELSRMIKGVELKFRKSVLELFHHRNLAVEAEFFEADITSVETWKMFGLGLSRRAAVGYGAFVGAVAGLAFDIPAGGLTFGIPTAIGTGGGAMMALLFAYSPFEMGRIKNKAFRASMQLKGQLPGVLLDRMIIFSRCVLHVSHGKRLEDAIKVEMTRGKGGADQNQTLGFVRSWNDQELKAWACVVGKIKKAPSFATLEDKEKEAFESVIKQIVNDLSQDM